MKSFQADRTGRDAVACLLIAVAAIGVLVTGPTPAASSSRPTVLSDRVQAGKPFTVAGAEGRGYFTLRPPGDTGKVLLYLAPGAGWFPVADVDLHGVEPPDVRGPVELVAPVTGSYVLCGPATVGCTPLDVLPS